MAKLCLARLMQLRGSGGRPLATLDPGFEAVQAARSIADPLISMSADVGRHVPNLLGIFADRAVRGEPPDIRGIQD